MAPTLLGLEKIGLAQPAAPRPTAAELRAQQQASSDIPQIAPAPPPPAQAQVGNIMAENEREAALNRPGAGFAGKAGQIANIASAFLHGVSQGRATAQIVKYQKMRQQGNDLATAYGMARQTLLPLELEAYRHKAAPGQEGMYVPSLGFKVDPRSFSSPVEFASWYKKYQSAYNAASGTKQAYVSYIRENTIPEPEKGAGKRKHRSVASNIFHKAGEIGKSILEGGPSIPEGYTEAAQQMAGMLPVGHTPDEIAAYAQEGTGVDLKSAQALANIEHVQQETRTSKAQEGLYGARAQALQKAPERKPTYFNGVHDGKAWRMQQYPGQAATPVPNGQLFVRPGAAAGEKLPPVFARQLNFYQDDYNRTTANIQSLEGKVLAAGSKDPGVKAAAIEYIKEMAGYPTADPVATGNQLVQEAKAHAATLQMQMQALIEASTNPGTPQEQLATLHRVAGMTSAPGKPSPKGNKGPSSSSEWVTVQIPGYPPAPVLRSRLKDFQKKYPSAKVVSQ